MDGNKKHEEQFHFSLFATQLGLCTFCAPNCFDFSNFNLNLEDESRYKIASTSSGPKSLANRNQSAAPLPATHRRPRQAKEKVGKGKGVTRAEECTLLVVLFVGGNFKFASQTNSNPFYAPPASATPAF